MITRTEFYDSYKDYCECFGLDVETPKKFTQALKSSKGISEGRLGNTRAWKGVKCKKICENGEIQNDIEEHKEYGW